jgi:hypothetical protein
MILLTCCLYLEVRYDLAMNVNILVGNLVLLEQLCNSL